MSENAASPGSYEAALARLAEQVRRSLEAESAWSPTPAVKDLLDIEQQLRQLADRVQSGPRWSAIEDAFGAWPRLKPRAEPGAEAGDSGFDELGPPFGAGATPLVEPLLSAASDIRDKVSAADAAQISATCWGMRAIADAAGAAADSLPDPRRRRALSHAALLYLHVHQWHGHPRPSLYGQAFAVQEFEALLLQAGAPRATETVRNLLSAALKKFDPFIQPPEVEWLLQG